MTYDDIIAGGGSSACAAAGRLVAEEGARVLLLERGPAKFSWLMRLPAGYMKFLARDTFLEMHKAVPQPQPGGRAPIVPQAKVLGGGSSVNAMVYMRGQCQDDDGWDAFLGGDSGWSYDDMLPVLRGMEGEMLPGDDARSDTDLQAFCAKTVKTNDHLVGTARMGPDGDPLAILDTRLRVRGVEGLRVVDCAAMPMIPSENTNAPALAMGFRAATLIMAEQRSKASAVLSRVAAR